MGISAVDPVAAAAASPSPLAPAAGDGGAFSSALRRALDAQKLPQVTLSEMAASWSPSTRFAAVSASGLGPALIAAQRTGAVGSPDVPPELRSYGNGRIPADALRPIGIGGHRLWAPAADAFDAMRTAAAADGIDIGVTDSYRSYDQQVELAARKGLYRDGGYAAVPGTSEHGWGLALDVDVTPGGLAWLRANAGRFGFVEAVPREPWHWEYHGS